MSFASRVYGITRCSPARDLEPVGQLVGVGVGVVEEPALLDDQPPRVLRDPARVPADRAHAAGALDRRDRGRMCSRSSSSPSSA